MYECKWKKSKNCPFKAKTLEDIVQHQQDQHMHIKTCKTCGFACLYDRDLNNHLKQVGKQREIKKEHGYL